MSQHSNRKDEHLALARALYRGVTNDFDNVKFVHPGISSVNVNCVDLSTGFLDIHFETPFFINAMTGGSEKTGLINEKLGKIAEKTGMMVATGSVAAAVKNPSLVSSYRVIREVNPKGIILANIGADKNLEVALKAIEVVNADGLQIHLNTAQELIMPEGERDFSFWESNIREMIENIDLPIIVKEVGCGFSQKTLERLISIGVKAVDISGRGGTNFIEIENSRDKEHDHSYLEDWGQSTVESLLESVLVQKKADILASGGIRNALDVVKALRLGAKSVGLAGIILQKLTTEGVEKTVDWIKNLENEIRVIFALLDVENIVELQEKTSLIFSTELVNYASQRRIDIDRFTLSKIHRAKNA